MTDLKIPDAAVKAAAEAIEDVAFRLLGRDLGTIHRDEIVAAGLAAALPLLGDTRTQYAVRVTSDGETYELNAHDDRDRASRSAEHFRDDRTRAVIVSRTVITGPWGPVEEDTDAT